MIKGINIIKGCGKVIYIVSSLSRELVCYQVKGCGIKWRRVSSVLYVRLVTLWMGQVWFLQAL